MEGFEMATVEQQKEQQSYFVRLGSLSSKLRHRAYQHSLGKLRTAKQGTQDALTQLHQTIELVSKQPGPFFFLPPQLLAHVLTTLELLQCWLESRPLYF